MRPEQGDFVLELWNLPFSRKFYLAFEVALLKTFLEWTIATFRLLWFFASIASFTRPLSRIHTLIFEADIPWLLILVNTLIFACISRQFGRFVIFLVLSGGFPKPAIVERVLLLALRRLLRERIGFVEVEFFLDVGEGIVIFMGHGEDVACEFGGWVIFVWLDLSVLSCALMFFEGRELIFFAFECLKLQLEFSYVESFVLIEVVDVKSFGDFLLLFQNDFHSLATTVYLFPLWSLFYHLYFLIINSNKPAQMVSLESKYITRVKQPK